MNKLSMGIIAHVDSGKTTLSEALLYTSGSIRKLGRVDNKDAFLDTYELERARGITIFSKQAVFFVDNLQITLLDTPGHVDFSAEMERTLQILDYAILVVSGADGVQGHTRILWRLLKKYNIPVFIFINKMDQPGTDKEKLLDELKKKLDDGCIDFTDDGTDGFYENVAMCDEYILDEYIENASISQESIAKQVALRNLFPCYFGSALKLDGVDTFLKGIEKYTQQISYPQEFGAKVYKISRDAQGTRLTHLKITGGNMKVRSLVSDEKVNQIRVYSGEKYEAVDEVFAGDVCAVTGFTRTRPGQGLGMEGASDLPVLTPVLTYQILLPPGCEAAFILPKLRQLEEEEPELHIVWNEQLQEIQAQIMGEIQIEILKNLIEQRFGISVEFGTGNIVYKETIKNMVEGVGHFEPLRHYAEVHLIMEPGERGSGLEFYSCCSEDILDRNWQRLVITHLEEKEHLGVLAGCPITDMKIILASGRAHLKHTEGGDFRQATYRAVRHGLMQAKSILLEPYYEFRLDVPDNVIGRALSDMDRLHAGFEAPSITDGMAVLAGAAPVATMRDYAKEVAAYTKGLGHLFCNFKGYEPCHNTDEIIKSVDYHPESDLDNPVGSVFCAHGAGFNVNWDEVQAYMHLESALKAYSKNNEFENVSSDVYGSVSEEIWIDTEEIDAILEKTFYANRRSHPLPHKGIRPRNRDLSGPVVRTFKPPVHREEYMLVDGYNIIFAWDDLKEIARDNIDGARNSLMDILCNYQAIRKMNLILVFDAYKVAGNVASIVEYKNIHVVYTKEAETADNYIERFAHENGRKYSVTVATSDGLEQMIIRSQGCGLLSARELQDEVRHANETIQKEYLEKQKVDRNLMFDALDEEKIKQVKDAFIF